MLDCFQRRWPVQWALAQYTSPSRPFKLQAGYGSSDASRGRCPQGRGCLKHAHSRPLEPGYGPLSVPLHTTSPL